MRANECSSGFEQRKVCSKMVASALDTEKHCDPIISISKWTSRTSAAFSGKTALVGHLAHFMEVSFHRYAAP